MCAGFLKFVQNHILMKNTYLLYALLLPFSSLLAQTPVVSLSSPVVVDTTSLNGSLRPRIALATGNVPVVIWGKSSPGKLFSSRFNGSSFSSAQQISPAGTDLYISNGEGPNIAAKNDTVYATWFSLPANSSRIYVVRSTDGGITFTDTIRASSQTAKPPYNPFVAIGQGGNPYITYEIATTTMAFPEQVFTRSIDGGNTFSPEVSATAMAPGEPCECCPSSLVLKDSVVFLLYRNNINNVRNIYAAVSQDHGATFSDIVLVDQTNWVINGCPASGPEGVLNGDSLVFAYMSRVNNYTRIYYNTLHATTLQPGPHRKLDPALTTTAAQRHPTITGTNDTIAILWDDNRTGYINSYMAVSVDGGATFSPPVLLSDTSMNATQQTPHAVYSNGVFHIVYQNAALNKVFYRTAGITGMLGTAPQQPGSSFTLSVSPNPFTQAAIIRFSNKDKQPARVLITDINGRTVRAYEGITGSSLEVERGALSQGIYNVTVVLEGGERAATKLVIIE